MISCETKTCLILYVKIYEHLENIKNGNDIKQVGSWSSTAETPGAVSRGTSGGSGHAIIDVFAPGSALAQPAPSRQPGRGLGLASHTLLAALALAQYPLAGLGVFLFSLFERFLFYFWFHLSVTLIHTVWSFHDLYNWLSWFELSSGVILADDIYLVTNGSWRCDGGSLGSR